MKVAMDESLQKPVDPLKMVTTKVSAPTMPWRVQTLTSRTAVAWPSPSSPPPGAWFVLAAIVQTQRPPPALGIEFRIPARGMSHMPLVCMPVTT
jgi:hypothetical protein